MLNLARFRLAALDYSHEPTYKEIMLAVIFGVALVVGGTITSFVLLAISVYLLLIKMQNQGGKGFLLLLIGLFLSVPVVYGALILREIHRRNL
jgi:hypothetical protein